MARMAKPAKTPEQACDLFAEDRASRPQRLNLTLHTVVDLQVATHDGHRAWN